MPEQTYWILGADPPKSGIFIIHIHQKTTSENAGGGLLDRRLDGGRSRVLEAPG
jgi:hypothetical protein